MFGSWDAVRSVTPAGDCLAATETAVGQQVETGQQAETGQQVESGQEVESGRQVESGQQVESGRQFESGQLRIDSGSDNISRPLFLDIDEATDQQVATTDREAEADVDQDLRKANSTVQRGEDRTVEPSLRSLATLGQPADQTLGKLSPAELSTADLGVAIGDFTADDSDRRRSPAALLVSTILHVVILLALAALTLNNRKPKDQVALAASVSDPNEAAMETFQIETSEPVNDPTEPTPSETAYELSPDGEMKLVDFGPKHRRLHLHRQPPRCCPRHSCLPLR